MSEKAQMQPKHRNRKTNLMSMNKILLAVALGVSLGIASCKKDWDAHNQVTDAGASKNLLEHVKANTSLSKFADLLTKTGYDTVIASSKNYTVFAPTNDALATLDPAVANDTAKLRKFVGNHIALLRYFTYASPDTLRIAMLSGKYNNMYGKKVETAAITTADEFASNGALQVIDKMLPVLSNCWEVVESSADFPVKQRDFLISLNYDGFDSSKAVQIGVDPVTGKPVYKPGSGYVASNMYWDKVYDMRNESQQYTFFALQDLPYESEKTVFKPYYATGTTDSTDRLSAFCVVKDFAIKGYVPQDKLPDTLVSKFGVKLPVNKAAIVKTIKTSNGIIYVMSGLSVIPKNKFKSIVIEAENYNGYSNDRRSNTYFRDRYNPLTGKNIRDVLVSGHGVAQFNLRYDIAEMPTLKYKAYWVAVNDFQTTTHTQLLGIGTPTSTVFAYTTVPLASYAEALIGEYTHTKYEPVFNIYLTAANSTTAAANPLVCDYIRLEPVL